ncbi:HNH endonuclease [Leptospira sp. 96542]|nr:HNH endonuclease [Leptospira sp. 96542]
MRNTKCLHCEITFTKHNNSDEHIFPQAIGGNLTIRNVFCRDCNFKLGKLYDTKLVENFHFYRNLFNAYNGYKRNRKRYKLQTNDTPLISYVNQDGSLKLEKGKYHLKDKEAILIGNDKESLTSSFEKISIKHPNAKLHIKQKEKDELFDFQRLSAKLCFATGDRDVSFSILKTALTAFLYLGRSFSEISHFPKAFHPHLYPSRLVSPIGIKQLYPETSTDLNLSHSVKIVYSFEKRAIFAIIELFNSFRYSVILSNRYFGSDKEFDLSQNAITGKKNEFKLNFSQDEFFGFLNATWEEQELAILTSWQSLRELTHLKMMEAGLGKKIGANQFGLDPNMILTKEHVPYFFPKFDFVERREFEL